MWDKASKYKCACDCGCSVCGVEPKTKEEKIAFLVRKEVFLTNKLDKIKKMKENLKSGKRNGGSDMEENEDNNENED